MTRLVIDPSVAIKWFVREPDSDDAKRLRERHDLLAPDLIVAECVNVLWKAARRGEITRESAALACRGLGYSGVVFKPMIDVAAEAGVLSMALDHPAYDCFFLALSAAERAPYVISDLSLVRKLRAAKFLEAEVMTLAEAVTLTA